MSVRSSQVSGVEGKEREFLSFSPEREAPMSRMRENTARVTSLFSLTPGRTIKKAMKGRTKAATRHEAPMFTHSGISGRGLIGGGGRGRDSPEVA